MTTTNWIDDVTESAVRLHLEAAGVAIPEDQYPTACLYDEIRTDDSPIDYEDLLAIVNLIAVAAVDKWREVTTTWEEALDYSEDMAFDRTVTPAERRVAANAEEAAYRTQRAAFDALMQAREALDELENRRRQQAAAVDQAPLPAASAESNSLDLA